MEAIDFNELIQRIDNGKSKSNYDDRHACCWQGYLAALLEWGLITPDQHKYLSDKIPVDSPDPSVEIFIG